MAPDVLPVVRSFAAALSQRFGDRLGAVRLFGSFARGEANQESDVDVCVLVHGLTRPEKIEIYGLATDHSLASGLHLSALAMAAEDFQRLRELEARLARDIDSEGISA